MFPYIHSLTWWSTLLVLAIATFTDLRSRRVPNWLVFPFLLAGPPLALISRGWSGLGRSLCGMLLGVLVLGILYILGGMGMGDVKLCAAIGSWIGPAQLGTALVITGIAGGVMAFLWALSSGYLKESIQSTANLVLGIAKRGSKRNPKLNLKHHEARKMPYVPAIAIGTVLSFLSQGAA